MEFCPNTGFKGGYGLDVSDDHTIHDLAIDAACKILRYADLVAWLDVQIVAG